MESNPSKGNEEEKDENQDFFYEITLTLSLKEIKTSTFNLRLNGIKDLDDFIEKNKNNKKQSNKINELNKNLNNLKEQNFELNMKLNNDIKLEKKKNKRIEEKILPSCSFVIIL